MEKKTVNVGVLAGCDSAPTLYDSLMKHDLETKMEHRYYQNWNELYYIDPCAYFMRESIEEDPIPTQSHFEVCDIKPQKVNPTNSTLSKVALDILRERRKNKKKLTKRRKR